MEQKTHVNLSLGVEQAAMSSAAISILSLVEDLVVDAGSTTRCHRYERKTHNLGFPHSTSWRQSCFSQMAADDMAADTGGEFGIDDLSWQYIFQFLSSDDPMLIAGRRILAAHRNSPLVSPLVLPQCEVVQMARRRERVTIDQFWDRQELNTESPQQPEPEQIKKPPLSKEEKLDRAIARYYNSSIIIACKKAHRYLWGILQKERQEALRRAMGMKHLSKSERMRRTWRCVSRGGLLPFARDEVMPQGLLENIDEYQPYVAMRVGEDEAQMMIRNWIEEGMSEAKYPNILPPNYENEEELKIPTFITRRWGEKKWRNKPHVPIIVDDQPTSEKDEIMKLLLDDD